MARKGYLRVAGVIENMTAFVCEHGRSYPLFGAGGGQQVADEVGAPLIGAVPLDPAVAMGTDTGHPVAADGEGPSAEAFASIAGRLVEEILPLVEMSGCTARMLDRVEAALDT
jgi:ATP-binding protein involved in chromosome partitioning